MDPRVLFELLRSWYGDDVDSPPLMVEVLRRECPRLVSTYLSASLALGTTRSLSSSLQAELDEVKARSTRLEEIRQRIIAVEPDAWFAKGGDLADLYEPLVRYSRDVDLVVGSQEQLWGLAQALTTDDFTATALLVVPLDGPVPELMLELCRPAASEWEQDIKVEVSTLFWVGNGSTVPSVRRTEIPTEDAAARHLLTITARALTNLSPTAKHVLDAHLLLTHGGRPTGSAARELATTFGVNRELNELLDLVTRHLPDRVGPGHEAARSGRSDLLKAYARRGRHLGRRLARHPRATLALMTQHRVLMAERWLPRTVWAHVVNSAVPGGSYGPWRFGMPCVVGDPSCTSPDVMQTPIGAFLLTETGAIDPDDLERLQLTPIG